ncbi:hypothetical protein GCM10007140_31410 [Priestia taiwanensis]|uniref:Methyltransferase type 11 domain-containing protein n=1 Tax=Priestia taiwanensis TaxID=1347902 RepID=A0A917ERD5_9BACI|nr:hypothetical protein GCM10007140_31410 [Priestia taiwanensis]
MRQIATSKEELRTVTFIDGDMENFPLPDFPIDTIVSTFVFHHLTDIEKQTAIKKYYDLLELGGKIIFGDTMFLSKDVHHEKITKAYARNHQNLAEDLQREYYPLLPNMERYFRENGFTTRFQQMNEYVWIVEAVKQIKNV